MKILKITISNIASLQAPPQTIDFTQPPLSETGIFAIVGPTGAGKSTILDAITLALFDKVFRYGKKSPGELIITRGAASGFVELTFAIASEQYRCRWEFNCKSGNKAMELVQLTPTEQIVETGSSRVPKAVEQRLGLSFERMYRSMILMQGAFAQFIQAQPKDKAELLQQLTGTTIYADVEAVVKQQAEDLRAQEEQLTIRLQDFAEATPEAIESITKELRTLQSQAATYQQQLQELEQHIELWKQIQQQQQELQRHQVQWEELQRQHQHLQQQATALPQYRQLRDYAALFDRYAQLAAERHTINQSIEEHQQQIQELTRQITDATQKLETIAHQREQQEQQLQHLQKELQDHQMLETKIREQRRYLQDLAEQGKTLKQELRELQKAAEEEQQLIAHHRQEIDRIHQWVNTHANYHQILQQQSEFASALREEPHLRQRLQQIDAELAALHQEMTSLQQKQQELQAKIEREEQQLAQWKTHHLTEIEHDLIARLRSSLQPGEPCPVCGSLHHPGATSSPPAAPAMEISQEQLEQRERQLQRQRDQLEQLKGVYAAKAAQHQQLTKQRSEVAAAQAAHHPLLARLAELAGTPITATEQLQRIIDQWQEHHSRLRQYQQELDRAEQRYHRIMKQIEQKEATLQRKRHQYTQLKQELTENEQEYRRRWGDRHPQQEWEQAHRQLEQLKQAEKSHQQQLEALRRQHTAAATQLQTLVERQQTIQQQLQALHEQLQPLLQQASLDSFDAAHRLLANREAFETLEEQLRTFQIQLQHKQATIQELQSQLQQLLQQPPPQSLETLQQQKVAVRKQLNNLHQTIGKLEQQLATLQEQQSKAKALEKELRKIRRERQRWEQLEKLIGRKELVKFVQRYTLDILLQQANRYLALLASRYHLQRANEMEIQILDRYFANQPRPIKSLSGGETFLTSIALALALSDLSRQRTRMDTLFIDEGFGSLDEQHLDQLLLLLEKLEAEGKRIGIISHLDSIRERFQTQVIVEPTANGSSRIRIATTALPPLHTTG